MRWRPRKFFEGGNQRIVQVISVGNIAVNNQVKRGGGGGRVAAEIVALAPYIFLDGGNFFNVQIKGGLWGTCRRRRSFVLFSVIVIIIVVIVIILRCFVPCCIFFRVCWSCRIFGKMRLRLDSIVVFMRFKCSAVSVTTTSIPSQQLELESDSSSSFAAAATMAVTKQTLRKPFPERNSKTRIDRLLSSLAFQRRLSCSNRNCCKKCGEAIKYFARANPVVHNPPPIPESQSSFK